MNRIILIGNGFDLAHGLKTSYKDFIDDFWKREIEKIKSYFYWQTSSSYSNDFIEIIGSFYGWKWVKDKTGESSYYVLLANNVAALNRSSFENHKRFFKIKNKFLEYITNEVTLQNWVDIEDVYHKFLNGTHDLNFVRQLGISVGQPYYSSVEELHKDFDAIKKLLEEYLLREIKEMPSAIDGMKEIINSPIVLEDFCSLGIESVVEYEYNKLEKEIEKIDNSFSGQSSMRDAFLLKYCKNYFRKIQVSEMFYVKKEERRGLLKSMIVNDIQAHSSSIENYELIPKNLLFLNFNYTPLEDLYKGKQDEVIHIHGDLDDIVKNPIIFGYGDELCEEYKALEKLNKNEYLENIKSIKYLETNNYKSLLSFIDSESYQIFIFGHSCGNSDRTLLNTLFEHDNCVSIKLFYYKDEEKGKDYYSDVVRNISRNFNDKKSLREKVVNKEISQTLPQLPKVEVKK